MTSVSSMIVTALTVRILCGSLQTVSTQVTGLKRSRMFFHSAAQPLSQGSGEFGAWVRQES